MPVTITIPITASSSTTLVEDEDHFLQAVCHDFAVRGLRVTYLANRAGWVASLDYFRGHKHAYGDEIGRGRTPSAAIADLRANMLAAGKDGAQ